MKIEIRVYADGGDLTFSQNLIGRALSILKALQFAAAYVKETTGDRRDDD